MLEINLKKCLFWLEVVGLNNANLFEQLYEKKSLALRKFVPGLATGQSILKIARIDDRVL